MNSQTKFKQTEIGTIPEDWGLCKKKGGYFYFNFEGKNKKIKFIEFPSKPFVSDGGPNGINVGKLFFEKFTYKERVGVLWHEYYHNRLLFLAKWVVSEIKYLWYKQAYWEEEYAADEFSAKKNNVNDCLSYLKTCKKLYDKKIILYNKKFYPPIDKRIENIKKLELNDKQN